MEHPLLPHDPRIGYVLEVYPRFTETCVVEEILAHERAGTDIEIFSLRTPVEGRFHETLAQVRARVTYLPSGSPAADLWADLTAAASVLPGLFTALEEAAARTRRRAPGRAARSRRP
jgi:colanic acid/amylovoran biosynthesis glycosyltransferase